MAWVDFDLSAATQWGPIATWPTDTWGEYDGTGIVGTLDDPAFSFVGEPVYIGLGVSITFEATFDSGYGPIGDTWIHVRTMSAETESAYWNDNNYLLFNKTDSDYGPFTFTISSSHPTLGDQFDLAVAAGEFYLFFETPYAARLTSLRYDLGAPVGDPPVNDDFADRIALSVGPEPGGGASYSVDATGASTEVGEDTSGPIERSIWYYWDAPFGGHIRAASIVAGMQIQVFTSAEASPGFADLAFEGALSDTDDLVSVSQGTRYYVQVASETGFDIGTYAFSIAGEGFVTTYGDWVTPPEQQTVWGGDDEGDTLTFSFPSTTPLIEADWGGGDARDYAVSFIGHLNIGKDFFPGQLGNPGEDPAAADLAWHYARALYDDTYLGGWPWNSGTDWSPLDSGSHPSGTTDSLHIVGVRYVSTEVDLGANQSITFLVSGVSSWFNLHNARDTLGITGQAIADPDDATFLPALDPMSQWVEWESEESTIVGVEVRPDEAVGETTDTVTSPTNWFASASIPDDTDGAEFDRFGETGLQSWGPKWNVDSENNWPGVIDGPEDFRDAQFVEDEFGGAIPRELPVGTMDNGTPSGWYELPDGMLDKAWAVEEEIADPADFLAHEIFGGLRFVGLPEVIFSDTKPALFAADYGELDRDSTAFRRYQYLAVRLTAQPSRYRVVSQVPWTGVIVQPYLRVFPRPDGIGASTAQRLVPVPRSEQRSNRVSGGYFY